MDLLEVCVGLPVRTIEPGEVLIDQGAPAGQMYVLVSGAVTAERDGHAIAQTDTPGAIFGEMSVVLGKETTATLRARTEVQVHTIDEPLDFLTNNPGAALAVLRVTASRLDGLTQYLVDVKQQLAGTSGHLGMLDQILDTLVHHQGPRARTGSARDPEGTTGHKH